MRAPRRVLGWAAGAALLSLPAAAHAAAPGPDALPITVITVQTDTADDQADALTKALRNAVRAMPGWSLGEGDFSLEVLTLSLKCSEPPDASCQSRIADQIKSDRYIWGVVQKKKDNTIKGEVSLWVRGKGAVKVAVDYTANLTEANDDALRKIATDTVTQLTGGPPKGGVKVKAGKVDGQCFADGKPLGALKDGEGTFMIPSGAHKITVRAEGYADAETQVVIKPTGSATEVTLTLTAAEPKSPTNWKRIGGYGLMGVGAALGAVGVVQSLQVNSLEADHNAQGADMYVYRQQHPKSGNVCDDAKNDTSELGKKVNGYCTDAATPQLLQAVFYPLAAVAVGAGAFLVATSGKKTAPKTGMMLLPQAGPGGAKLDVVYAW
ncbi:MAG: PEGA domain-containing protein [Byssovorax sp.]